MAVARLKNLERQWGEGVNALLFNKVVAELQKNLNICTILPSYGCFGTEECVLIELAL